jgi:hypothetical protein
MHSRDERSEYFATPKDDTPKEWDIGISFLDKTRPEDDIEFWIFFKCITKFLYITYIVLSIGIKGDKILPSVFSCITTNILEACFESSSRTTIGDMMNKVNGIFFNQRSQDVCGIIC